MHIDDILCETFPFPAGSPMPANIIDYRDPAQAKGQHRKYSDSQGKMVRYWSKQPRTHVVLTKTGGIIVFYYGHHNTIEYGELLTLLQQAVDPMQGDVFDIVVKDRGYLLDRSRSTGSWGGDRNRYSSDVVDIVRALHERGVASLDMPIWIGNWAANEGEHIGTVRSILVTSDFKQIKLFHGTDTYRLQTILKTGLRPLAFNDRVWNRTSLDKQRPAHRDEAIYLTASRPQAEYYAKKAVNIDRKRFGPAKRGDLRSKFQNAERSIRQMTAALARYDQMSDEQIAAEDAHDKRFNHYPTSIATKRAIYPGLIAKAQSLLDRGQQFTGDFYGTIEPVILQVILRKREFDKLMADDDHLRQNPDASPDDWHSSLSQFGQIAFKGTIPPDRITVVGQGATAKQISQ